MAFIDRARVHVEAGTGGSGCTSFRREHRVPMGGPDGGDGGHGGDVIIKGDRNLATLLDYSYRDRWVAERGEHGMGNNKTGRSGADVTLPVPAGTVVRDANSRELLGEVLDDGDSFVVAKAGRGGKGNTFFATATHQSPREWQPGEEGEVRAAEEEKSDEGMRTVEAIGPARDGSDLPVRPLGAPVVETERDVREDALEVSLDRARELLEGLEARPAG